MNAQHTPGPWDAAIQDGCHAVIASTSGTPKAVAAIRPIPADEVADQIRSMDLDLREDMCAFSFRSGVRWAEKQHGIGGG